jgi:sugar (pentulose or hexulose) kinase
VSGQNTQRLVAVIDIGKTNKKVAIFDANLQQIAHVQAPFPAARDAQGVLVEQTAPIWAWLKQQLAALYRQHPFAALSITTHGAAWAALAADGSLALPVIAYEHELGETEQQRFDAEFYARCGRLETLQDETGTCDLPLLVNPAKMVLFAQQHYRAGWTGARHLVNYPQYWGHLLTGALASEATYSANHSFLFDIRARRASSAAHALGVADMLDFDFKAPWAQLGTLRPELQTELGLPALPVTVGIHDSNSALLLYLVKHQGRDFVVNSTGTWCVAMHRVDAVSYRPEELGQKVIFNIDALGGLTKTSFLMGGQDYGLYHGVIGGTDPAFAADRVDAALADPSRLVLPGAFPSQFPNARGGLRDGAATLTVADLQAGKAPAWFTDPARGHDLLNISLALQTEVALRRTGINDGTAIFIEGGFRNNPTFLAVLAALFPHNPVCCTSLVQATAAGAALLGQALLDHTSPATLADRISIEEQPVARPSLPHLAAYRAAWLAAVA